MPRSNRQLVYDALKNLGKANTLAVSVEAFVSYANASYHLREMLSEGIVRRKKATFCTGFSRGYEYRYYIVKENE